MVEKVGRIERRKIVTPLFTVGDGIVQHVISRDSSLIPWRIRKGAYCNVDPVSIQTIGEAGRPFLSTAVVFQREMGA
jgi:hypothetical protein